MDITVYMKRGLCALTGLESLCWGALIIVLLLGLFSSLSLMVKAYLVIVLCLSPAFLVLRGFIAELNDTIRLFDRVLKQME